MSSDYPEWIPEPYEDQPVDLSANARRVLSFLFVAAQDDLYLEFSASCYKLPVGLLPYEVNLAINELLREGLLELVSEHSGPRPAVYRFVRPEVRERRRRLRRNIVSSVLSDKH